MAVQIIEAHPGYSLAYKMKMEELDAQFEVVRAKLRDFINNNIIATGYPELVGKSVTAVFDNNTLTLHVNTPDEAVSVEAVPVIQEAAAPESVPENVPEAVPTQATDETQVTN